MSYTYTTLLRRFSLNGVHFLFLNATHCDPENLMAVAKYHSNDRADFVYRLSAVTRNMFRPQSSKVSSHMEV